MSLVIENLSFSYSNKIILDNLHLSLGQGDIGTLIGASGSGKSTLFKLLAGLLPLHQGSIYINGHSLDSPERTSCIAYMMQQDLLLPWRTVLANVMLVAELGLHPNPQALQEEAYRLLDEMGLRPYLNYYPEQLSGGMRQRVSLARSLLQKRPILLLDEPFGALDVGLREHLYQLLHQVRDKYGTTILMVTHDFRDALSLSQHLFLLSQKRIYKKWTLSSDFKSDFIKMGHLQTELQALLNYSPTD
ncbi:ABC transporter ATP-binding protein [Candidatus Protochlamydia phocaeensis]|uniref:ABC transporter ATP-binding protein n=1 Tax=Candidatus Protochlamydia phocaeensis TaxID=1414722 RepID=UPI0008393960|nr:ABC transporter ATP-binding protein [Candidatus Protochlamydia phocaeensis]